MSNLLQDLDIEGALQCPVCYEIPPKTIFMCKIGHHMCERCRWRLTTCPTCKSAITGCRNFLGEALTTKFSVLLKGGGDTLDNNNLDDAINAIITKDLSKPLLNDNVNPLKKLSNPSGSYQCLLESCRNRKGMGVGDMISHIEKTHAHIFDKFQNTTATFKHKFENFFYKKGVHKYHRGFKVSNMGLFFLNLETIQDDYINCWISTPAPKKRCDSFLCEIVFSKEDSTKTVKFSSKVASNLQEKMRMFETGKIFVVTPENHELSKGEFFCLDVKIVYKAPVTASAP